MTHLHRLFRMRIYNSNLSGLGETFLLIFYDRLVNTGLDDFMAYVISTVHVESLLIETKPDREWYVLHEDEMGGVKRYFQG